MASLRKRETEPKDIGLIAIGGKGDTANDAVLFQNSPRHVNDQPCAA
jgi:hypothetical protein